MYKNRFKSLAAMSLVLLLAMCTKYQDLTNPIFGTRADLTASDLKADGIANFLFSTDNGATWVSNPILTSGQKYYAKVQDSKTGNIISIGNNIYTFDWSGSKPKPTVTTADSALFTFGGETDIEVKIANVYCSYDASIWTGSWTASIPGTTENDAQDVTADNTTANKFWMDNVWGDGGSGYFIMSPSTNYFDQVVSMPTQNVADPYEGPSTVSGSGTYNQCTGIITMSLKYTVLPGGNHPGDAGTYAFTYVITKN